MRAVLSLVLESAITMGVSDCMMLPTAPQNAGPSADSAKLKSIICKGFGNYPETVKQDLADLHLAYKHSPTVYFS